jgi:glycosyltransferase involved in cell wall biosynthesis
MKVGMILDEIYPPHPRVKNEAINLLEAGHEIIIFSLNYTNLPKSENIDGIKIVRYKANKIIRKLSALAYSVFIYRWLMQQKIKKFISEYKPEVIHIHNIRIGRAVLKSTKRFKGKIILDLHENIPEIMKMYHHVIHFPGNILIFPSRWKKWEKKLTKRVDKIIVVTDEAKLYLIKNYNISSEKIITVPNSVQPSFYSSLYLDNNIISRFDNFFSLLYFGDTGVRRGLETAIKSIPQLKNKIPNIHLIIVGQSKSDPYLKNISKKFHVEKYVTFEGFKDESLLQSYISASDICISPLLRNVHHDTTFANKIFQYMALGKPLVVSDCPAQKRIIKEANSGLIFESNNINDFSAKILMLFENNQLRNKLGKNGSIFIRKKYNQIKMSKELIKYYNSL